MEFDPKIAQFLTSDKSSCASVSVNERWPIIINGAVNDVNRTLRQVKDVEKQKEGEIIVDRLFKLKSELQHDWHLTPLADDGNLDIALYNQELEQRGNPTWHNVPWLYSECYLYRRIETLFSMTKHWKGYDVFARQKTSTFKLSRPAVVEISSRYRKLAQLALEGSPGSEICHMSPPEADEAEKLVFAELCEACLWGNATDLSLLTPLNYEDIQKLQGSEARKKSQKNIIVNDLDAAFETLKKARRGKDGGRRVDIVLDNSGFELFVDLILAGCLLSSGLATFIVLHPKLFPWFVSDVTQKDFFDLMNIMADPQAFYTTADDSGAPTLPLSSEEAEDFRFIFEQWARFYKEGVFIIRPHAFWTTPGCYWRLPYQAPDLYQDLKESELVIFKGDLNYRKLTSDAQWHTTTPFSTTIGPMGPGSGIRALAFRTCKADTVVGLKAGEDERLRQLHGGSGAESRKWAWTGKWAVMSFSNGKGHT